MHLALEHQAMKQTGAESLDWTDALFDLTMPKNFEPDTLADMHEQFLRGGYVKLPDFLTPAALHFLQSELRRLEAAASRRTFEMPGYLSPRNLSVLGGRAIKEHSRFLYRLYHHTALRTCVEAISGRPIFSCIHPEEFMVANFLQSSGDTHGWHLDDPPYALVIFAETPKPGEGGEVEIIPNWSDLCRRKQRQADQNIADLIAWAEENSLVDWLHHKAGDAYLLRADLNLHRVVPITAEGARRCVINMAFQTAPETEYADTADLLYGNNNTPAA